MRAALVRILPSASSPLPCRTPVFSGPPAIIVAAQPKHRRNRRLGKCARRAGMPALRDSERRAVSRPKHGCVTMPQHRIFIRGGKLMSRVYNVIDADGHILEPLDLWDNYMDPKYRDLAPPLVVDPKTGKEKLDVEVQMIGSQQGMGVISVVGVRQRGVKAAV